MAKERVLFGGWGVILLVGFLATKIEFLFQDWNRLWVLWAVLTLIGFGLLVRTMNLRDRRQQWVLGCWVLMIGIGLGFTPFLPIGVYELFPYIGAIWLLVMGGGHLGTSVLRGDRRFRWTGLAQVAVGALLILLHTSPLGDTLVEWQFVITGLVGAGSMFTLLVPRSALSSQRA